MDTGAVIFGALIGGVIFGLIPGIVGYKKGKTGLAVAGFISCIIGSFLLGMFLSIPACIIFTVIICLSKDSQSSPTRSYVPPSYYTPSYSESKKCIQCQNPLDGTEQFCKRCGASQIKNENQGFCPSCGSKIESGLMFCVKCGTRIK